MAETPDSKLPYPLASDPTAGAKDIKALAAKTDTEFRVGPKGPVMVPVVTDGVPRLSLIPSVEGFTKLTKPPSGPSGPPVGVAFSPGGDYLAAVVGGAPYLYLYRRCGDEFIKLVTPTLTGASNVACVEFSPCGSYLAIGQISSVDVMVLKRVGDTFTQLSVPSFTSDGAYDVSFSPNGLFLAVAHADGDYLTIFKREGDTFTKVSITNTNAPTEDGFFVSYSPCGRYLGLGTSSYATSYSLRIYGVAGYNLLAMGVEDDDLDDSVWGVHFSPNGKLCIVSFTGMSLLYEREEEFFFVGEVELDGRKGMFTPDGRYFLARNGLYSVSSTTFQKVSGLTTPLGGQANALSSDGKYLAVDTGYTGDRLSVYKISGPPLPGSARPLIIED